MATTIVSIHDCDSQAVSNAWKATARDRIMYVCDDLPSHAQGESVEFSQFDFDKDDTSVQAEKNAAALSCNTDKDKTETNTKSFGWFCSVYNCGICFCARELYRSEGKHAVAVFFATMLLTLVHAGVNVPMYIAYDDACHLVQRCLSLCGVHWIFAALVTMVVVVDKFHFSNHKDTWCVRCLNPHRYKQLDDNNTESCECALSLLCIAPSLSQAVFPLVQPFQRNCFQQAGRKVPVLYPPPHRPQKLQAGSSRPACIWPNVVWHR